MILIMLPAAIAFALEMPLNNYYYTHTNTPGTYVLADRYGNKSLNADSQNNNGKLLSLSFKSFKGLQSNDKLYIRYTDGTTQAITDDVVTLNKNVPSIQVVLEKSSRAETYIAMYSVGVDDADAPEPIRYIYNGVTPTDYGQLGEGDPGNGGNVETIPLNHYYVPYRDEYRADYKGPSAVSKYQLYFKSKSGTVYTLDYAFKPTGIHYLTCNGTYNLNFFDSSDKLIAKTNEVETNQIQAPTCRSYEDSEGAGRNELNAKLDPDGNISWNDPPTGTKEVQIWKDGNKVKTNDPSDKRYPKAGTGSYSVVAVDSSGNPLGQSDLNVVDNTGQDPGGTTPGTDCGTCEKLDQLLQCPGWDIAMGDLTEAIQNALPPPPNWDDIADKIGKATVHHLSNYLGDVPVPPSKEDIKQATEMPLPILDLKTDVEDLKPNVPDEYKNGKIEFNLEKDAPQIEVKQDTTEGFDITEPLWNMETDGPGKPILPGDPNNNSGGIKQPDKVVTEEVPKPKKIIFEIPKPDVPKPSTPEPGETPSPPAIPNNPGGDTALPGFTEGPIPIPGETP